MKQVRKELSDLQLRMAYSREHISVQIERLGKEISKDYAGQDVVVIVVLTGALFFAADLIRQLNVPLLIDSVQLASYQGMHSTGNVTFIKDVSLVLKDRNVLVVEDIIDTGLSLCSLMDDLRMRGVRDIRVCTLIDKQENRRCEIFPDYVGMASSGGFLVGYGLDFDGRFRELPDIYEVISDTCSGGHNDRPV